MNEEKQLATLVGLDLILSPEHYKEIEDLQQENKQLKENKKKVIEILYDDNYCHIVKLQKIKEILGDKKNE